MATYQVARPEPFTSSFYVKSVIKTLSITEKSYCRDGWPNKKKLPPPVQPYNQVSSELNYGRITYAKKQNHYRQGTKIRTS